MNRPFLYWRSSKARRGSFYASIASLTLACFLLLNASPIALAADGALEALELRYQAERVIAQERASGRAELAEAMQESLGGLLQEYLATRDGTIALDTVDDIFVQEQFKTARAMEEPGVALALDVFSGPGTGYENELRTSIANLADFHAQAPERRMERLSDRDLREQGHKISEADLDAYERNMEKQIEKVERNLEKIHAVAEHLDAKFDARLEAKLDAAATKVEELRHRADELRTAADGIAAKDPEKAEKAESKAEKVAEKPAEKAEEKAEKAAEKAEEKSAEKVEKAEEKSEKKGKK